MSSYSNSRKRSPQRSPSSPPQLSKHIKVRQFKVEPGLPYTPALPFYSGEDNQEEEEEETRAKETKLFRCPFRKEDTGAPCTRRDSNKDEILNHFYKYHFERICSGNVFEENLNCFYIKCHENFSTHEKLVKHMHDHGGSKGSMFYIKYLIDNLEREKKESVDELKQELKAQRTELETKNQNLVQEHEANVEGREKEWKEKEVQLKDDLKYYKKKYDAFKKTSEEDKKAKSELKNEIEKLQNEKKEHKESVLKLKGEVSELKEERANLRGKLSIQRENCAERDSKLEKMAKKCSNFGPNSENALLRKNHRLEKQLEQARRIILEKNEELKKRNDEICKLELTAGSDDEFANPSGPSSSTTSTGHGEYVESD